MNKKLDIVIPIYNEQENISILFQEHQSLSPITKNDIKLVFIDDMSTDETSQRIISFFGGSVELITLPQHSKQGDAIWQGLSHCTSEYIAILDGDGQTPIAGAIECYKIAVENNLDAVLGFRNYRNDRADRKIVSFFANTFARLILKSKIKDMGCSTKVIHNSLLFKLHKMPNFHRYIGYQIEAISNKMRQIPISHCPRKNGKSKSGLHRAIPFLNELIEVIRIRKYLKYTNLDQQASIN